MRSRAAGGGRRRRRGRRRPPMSPESLRLESPDQWARALVPVEGAVVCRPRATGAAPTSGGRATPSPSVVTEEFAPHVDWYQRCHSLSLSFLHFSSTPPPPPTMTSSSLIATSLDRDLYLLPAYASNFVIEYDGSSLHVDRATICKHSGYLRAICEADPTVASLQLPELTLCEGEPATSCSCGCTTPAGAATCMWSTVPVQPHHHRYELHPVRPPAQRRRRDGGHRRADLGGVAPRPAHQQDDRRRRANHNQHDGDAAGAAGTEDDVVVNST
jgi:hypothetical protein